MSALSPYFAALCFGIGVGAIRQVIIGVVGLLIRAEDAAALTRLACSGGIAIGQVVMYV